MNVTFGNPTPHSGAADNGLEIVVAAIKALEGRLRSRGCSDPLLTADLAVAAFAERLSPVEAVRRANSAAATSAVRRLFPEAVRFPQRRGA